MKDAEILDLVDAGVHVLVEQRLENLPRNAAVPAQEVALLDVVRAFAARQRLLVEGNMTDEVEIVDIGHPFLRLHRLEVDALQPQLLANRLFLLLGRPVKNEVVERGVFAADIELRVVGDALDQAAGLAESGSFADFD